MIPNFLSNKRFWIFECVATVLLSLNTILWLGRNIGAILLIALTFFISNMIAWIISDKRVGPLCFLSWLFGGGAYALDIVLIDWFKMSTHESYPLIMGSMLLAPLFAAINGVICLSVWIIVAKIYKRVELKRTVAIILSCLGAIGAGICIGAGLYWWFLALGLIAILSGWWCQNLLRSIPNKGIIWAYQSIDKIEWYQNWKPKTKPITGTDYLSQLKIFLPFIQITLFVFFTAIVGSGRSNKPNNVIISDNVSSIPASEAIKNGGYNEDEVYDLSMDECHEAVRLLEAKLPNFVVKSGFGYKLSDKDGANDSIQLYEFSDYHVQLIGVIENKKKIISAICTKEYSPTYPNELILYKGTPPDIISFRIDIENKTVTL